MHGRNATLDDLVAATDGLRLVTVLEAASGLAVITGAITYLLSVYPLVSQVRVAARSVAPAVGIIALTGAAPGYAVASSDGTVATFPTS